MTLPSAGVNKSRAAVVNLGGVNVFVELILILSFTKESENLFIINSATVV